MTPNDQQQWKGNSLYTVDDVVSKALAFKASLTASQQATLEQAYTPSLARKWSNLPCGSGCRNGIQFGTLTATQLGLALEVIKAAAGIPSNEGYDEFNQIRLADNVLKTQYGANGYDSTIYFIAYLNTPTTSGQWMLQYGGHHYASNIGFNGGKVVGPTPQFRGVEPTSFTVSGTTYAPLNQELTALRNMLASFTTAQLATAKNSNTYSDVTMAPGETNGGNGTFPSTKAGIAVNTLDASQQALVLAAIEPYIQDIDDASAAVLRTVYANGINGTYVTWTGNGTSGNPGSFLNANTNYVRIDGPRVWIEFICQNGIVIPSQIHYHSVWRDHYSDYGADLTNTALPVSLIGMDAKMQGSARVVTWNTAEESLIRYYDVERSSYASGYTSIGKVAAKNNASNNYSFTDNSLLTDKTVYYRLKITDKNGNIRYTEIVSVKNNAVKNLVVYPNPAKNLITLLLSEEAAKATIKINNAEGKTVKTIVNQDERKIDVDISNLPTGSYYAEVMVNGKTPAANFIKQ